MPLGQANNFSKIEEKITNEFAEEGVGEIHASYRVRDVVSCFPHCSALIVVAGHGANGLIDNLKREGVDVDLVKIVHYP